MDYGGAKMFKEGSRECIEKLLQPSKMVLSTGLPIRNEPYDRRMALWNEIKGNADQYRNENCGRFLADLNAHFLTQFDASLLLLAIACQQNNEPFEGSTFFSSREKEIYERIESFSYFRILTKNEISKKIRTKDERTLALLKEYSVSMKKWVDDTLEDATVRDSIRSFLKKQWGDTSKKIGEAITVAGVDLDWFATISLSTDAKEKTPQTVNITITAGDDAAINLGNGNVVKDAVMTGSTIKSSGGGGTTVRDAVLTKSTIESSGTAGQPSGSGVIIQDSVLTGSSIKNVQETAPPVPGMVCKKCGGPVAPGAKFCSACGEVVPVTCKKCNNSLHPNAKFCTQCGERVN